MSLGILVALITVIKINIIKCYILNLNDIILIGPCNTCNKPKGGFLFRCEVCPKAFCEDCLPTDHEFVGGISDRWVPLGFDRIQTHSCFIHCSEDCKNFYTMHFKE